MATDPPQDLDQTICFCHAVTRGRLLEVIQAGAISLYSIQEETGASTGCGGCEIDVLEILADWEAQPKKP